MPEPLKDAVIRWVAAEYHFRCSPAAYTDWSQKHFEKAGRKLRRALTGRGDIEKAFETLGLPKIPESRKEKNGKRKR